MNNSLEIIANNLSLIPANQDKIADIFGFGEFVSALALLIIVYTTTNNRYKFRLSIVPFPLKSTTFIFLSIIGLGTLLMETWFSKHWIIPEIISDYILLQLFFAGLFLLTILLWIYYAFIKPPIFGKSNSIKFIQESYKLIINGSYNDLIMLADEIGRSSYSIIKASSEHKIEYIKLTTTNKIEPKSYLVPDNQYANDAYNLILLLANKKFCKQIISTSPSTVIRFINAIDKTKKYNVPIEQFLANVSLEAILNKNSILYEENQKYSYDLIGNNKLFSKTLFGNFKLLKEINHPTLLGIDYQIKNLLDEEQFQVFTNVVLVMLQSHLKEWSVYWNHFNAFQDPLEIIKESTSEIYKLNNMKNFEEISSSIYYKKFQVTVDFINEFIELLENNESKYYKLSKSKHDSYNIPRDIYDILVEIIFETIINISKLNIGKRNVWWIHYNMFWSKIQKFKKEKDNKVFKIINYKLRRRLYDEFQKFEQYENYYSAYILGFILNIFGLKANTNNLSKRYYRFHKLILHWTKYNYLKVLNNRKDIAKACLIGFLNYDKKKNRLIYTANSRKSHLKLK